MSAYFRSGRSGRVAPFAGAHSISHQITTYMRPDTGYRLTVEGTKRSLRLLFAGPTSSIWYSCNLRELGLAPCGRHTALSNVAGSFLQDNEPVRIEGIESIPEKLGNKHMAHRGTSTQCTRRSVGVRFHCAPRFASLQAHTNVKTKQRNKTSD